MSRFCTSCWSVLSLYCCWDWSFQDTKLYKLLLRPQPSQECPKPLGCPAQLHPSPSLCHLQVTGDLSLEMVSGILLNSHDFYTYSKYFQLFKCLLKSQADRHTNLQVSSAGRDHGKVEFMTDSLCFVAQIIDQLFCTACKG